MIQYESMNGEKQVDVVVYVAGDFFIADTVEAGELPPAVREALEEVGFLIFDVRAAFEAGLPRKLCRIALRHGGLALQKRW